VVAVSEAWKLVLRGRETDTAPEPTAGLDEETAPAPA
jgi:hypothetical protein